MLFRVGTYFTFPLLYFMKWKDLTIKQYQGVRDAVRYYSEDFDQVCAVISVVFNLSYSEVNKLSVKRFLRLSERVSRLFSKEPSGRARNRIGRYSIDYNVAKYKWRQYVEIQHFIKLPLDDAFHLILASAAAPLFRKNDSAKHKRIADRLLNYNFLDCYFSVRQILENVTALNKRFQEPEEVPEEIEEDEDEEQVKAPPAPDFGDGFIERWGWIYSTTRIAEHRRISLDEAYELTATQALNDLRFIKELQKHEENQIKNAKATS